VIIFEAYDELLAVENYWINKFTGFIPSVKDYSSLNNSGCLWSAWVTFVKASIMS
jgi:hypothetical protein